MFLKKGSIPELIYPGTGGEHVRTINLGRRVNNLHVVMSGHEIGFTQQTTRISNILMNLWVVHTNGNNTAELHFKVKLNDLAQGGDTFHAMVKYVLIGEKYIPPISAATKSVAKKKVVAKKKA